MLEEIWEALKGAGESLGRVPQAAMEDIKRAPEHGRAFLARFRGAGKSDPEKLDEPGSFMFGPPGIQSGVLMGMGRLTPETRKQVESALGRMTEAERAWLTGPESRVAVGELGSVPSTSLAARKMEAKGPHAQTSTGSTARGAVRLGDPAYDPGLRPSMIEEELRHIYEGVRTFHNPGVRNIAIELYAQPEFRPIKDAYLAEGRSPEGILREIAANAHRGVLSGPGRPDLNSYDQMYGRALQSPTVRKLYENLFEQLRQR